MTREEKIREILEKYAESYTINPLLSNDTAINQSSFGEVIKEILAIDDWISVEDEPTLYKNYLCTVHNEPPVVSNFNGECWIDRNGDEVFNIIKYRPLPTTPKGE